MNDTTALVTGANKGLGREVARQLGRLGAVAEFNHTGPRTPVRARCG